MRIRAVPVPVSTVALLALTSFAAPACKTSSANQPPQAQTAGLRIDVQSASYSQRKKEIYVRTKIWNDHDERVNFDLGSVRLMFNDRQLSPLPAKAKDPNPDVQAKSSRVFEWTFDVGDVIGEGNYPIEIRDISKGGQPLGETAQFRIVLGA